MPIAKVKLMMMASVADLVAQHFPHKVDDWEGLPACNHTWRAWKVAFCLAHLKHQHQLQASSGGKPLGGAHSMLPAPQPSIDWEQHLTTWLLQHPMSQLLSRQLMPANLTLMTLIITLTAANKKLVDAVAKPKGVSTLAAPPGMPGMPGMPGVAHPNNTHFNRNYCWTHGHWCSQNHTSASCGNKTAGHKDNATIANTIGSSNANKGWNTCT